jgi:hypothetical protein
MISATMLDPNTAGAGLGEAIVVASTSMRIARALLLLALLPGCPVQEEGSKKPSSEPGVSSEAPVVKTEKTTSIGTSAGAPVVQVSAQTSGPTQVDEAPCDGAPAWAKVGLCKSSDGVYAAASAPKTHAESLARTAASQRARAKLVDGVIGSGDGTFKLKGAEVLDVYACKDATWALARTAATDVSANLPACDAAAVAQRSAPKAGCPDWVNRGAWRDGDLFDAVGSSESLKSKDLAVAAAQNRARAELGSMLERDITRQGGTIGSSSAQQGAWDEVDKKDAECGGETYVLLRAKLK